MALAVRLTPDCQMVENQRTNINAAPTKKNICLDVLTFITQFFSVGLSLPVIQDLVLRLASLPALDAERHEDANQIRIPIRR